MSVQAMTRVLEHSKVKGAGPRLILLVIAGHETEDRGAFPSIERLAHECGMSVRSVQRAIRVAEAQGELEVTVGAGPHGTNLYRTKVRGVRTSPRQSDRGGAKTGPDLSPELKELGVKGSSTASASSHLNGRKRANDPIWDGFVAWLGRSPATRSERSKWNAAAKELREVGVDSAGEVERRGREYQRRHPTWEPTPNALAAHWGEFSPPTPVPEPLDIRRIVAHPEAEAAYLAGDYDKAREVLRHA